MKTINITPASVQETSSNVAYIHHHLGLGDHIICNAIVRYYAKKYKKIFLFVFTRNLESVAYMFRDLDNIKYLTINNENYEGQFVVVNSHLQFNPNITYLKIGFDYLHHRVKTSLDQTDKLTGEQLFYEQVGLPWSERYDGFYIERNAEAEEEVYKYYNPNDEPYVFVHQDTNRKRIIDFKHILNKDIKIINFNKKLTDKHQFKFFDHMKLIENAEECHMIDSSFKCLADSFLKDKKNMFFHRYTNFDSFGPDDQKGWTTSDKFWIIL